MITEVALYFNYNKDRTDYDHIGIRIVRNDRKSNHYKISFDRAMSIATKLHKIGFSFYEINTQSWIFWK